jgi:hypothetical protein
MIYNLNFFDDIEMELKYNHMKNFGSEKGINDLAVLPNPFSSTLEKSNSSGTFPSSFCKIFSYCRHRSSLKKG